jgi:CheY-like chemotaxis protein
MEERTFAATAKHLARNPLGIIALFIVLIYGFASLVAGFSGRLQASERLPVIWFLVVFPVLVLAVFSWLVSCHHAKLYSPADYREDASFIQASVQQVEVAAAIAAATAQKLDPGVSIEESGSETRAAAGRVAKLITRETLQSVRARRLLWVDDHANNNAFEREALQSLGFTIAMAYSTDEALSALQRESFDVVISDMNRAPDPRAGFTLLSRLRADGLNVPYIIYSRSGGPDRQVQAWKRGALGITSRPDELLAFVVDAVATTPAANAA